MSRLRASLAWALVLAVSLPVPGAPAGSRPPDAQTARAGAGSTPSGARAGREPREIRTVRDPGGTAPAPGGSGSSGRDTRGSTGDQGGGGAGDGSASGGGGGAGDGSASGGGGGQDGGSGSGRTEGGKSGGGKSGGGKSGGGKSGGGKAGGEKTGGSGQEPKDRGPDRSDARPGGGRPDRDEGSSPTVGGGSGGGILSLFRPTAPAVDPAGPASPEPRRKKRARPAAPPASTVAPPPAKPRSVAGFSHSAVLCLDPDLYGMLAAAYGPNAALSACAAGCVPRPAASLAHGPALDAKAAAEGVHWCAADCIPVDGWLPVEEVLRLEELTGRTFCPVDAASACSVPAHAAVADRIAAARIAASLAARAPQSPGDGDRMIVIGNGGYGGGVPAKDTARRDVETMVALATGPLGLPRDRVIVRQDLTAAGLRALFAPGGALDGLPEDATLTVYVSAQGRADADGEATVLGVDARPDAPVGLPLADLYQGLRRAGARTIVLALEVDFAAGDLLEAPNLPTRDIRVLPSDPVPGLSVFTAADRDQRTLVDPEIGSGLFTAALARGLAGAADDPPIGNGDRRIEAVELHVYVANRVRVSARKMFGLEQKPLLAEAGNRLLARY